MMCRGEQVRKPQGYRQTVTEGCFFLLVLCLPYWQSLLFAGISGAVSVLLLTCLLMFVVVRSPEVYRTITACLLAFPFAWAAPSLDRRGDWVCPPFFTIARWPSLATSFQRPPPIFS